MSAAGRQDATATLGPTLRAQTSRSGRLTSTPDHPRTWRQSAAVQVTFSRQARGMCGGQRGSRRAARAAGRHREHHGSQTHTLQSEPVVASALTRDAPAVEASPSGRGPASGFARAHATLVTMGKRSARAHSSWCDQPTHRSATGPARRAGCRRCGNTAHRSQDPTRACARRRRTRSGGGR
jgi:hypothetical protein